MEAAASALARDSASGASEAGAPAASRRLAKGVSSRDDFISRPCNLPEPCCAPPPGTSRITGRRWQWVAEGALKVGGVKSMLFGGEGVFLAQLTGPGHVWLQSLPFSRMAGRMFAAAYQRGGGKEEGSVLGGLGGILSGDRGF